MNLSSSAIVPGIRLVLPTLYLTGSITSESFTPAGTVFNIRSNKWAQMLENAFGEEMLRIESAVNEMQAGELI